MRSSVTKEQGEEEAQLWGFFLLVFLYFYFAFLLSALRKQTEPQIGQGFFRPCDWDCWGLERKLVGFLFVYLF